MRDRRYPDPEPAPRRGRRDSAAHWVEGQVNAYLVDGVVPKRHGTGGAAIVPYQVFDTADHPLCLVPGNDRLWACCARALGHPEWATDEKFATSAQRVRNRTELLPQIATAMRTRKRAEWVKILEEAGVPCSPVNDIGELVATEQFAASELVQQLPDGGPRVVGIPITFDRVRPQSAWPAPRLGEHTREVLGGRRAD